MAYTIEQSSTGIHGVADDIIYVVIDTTNTGELNYRYVCSVNSGGSELIQLKQLPNNNGSAVFNIKNIVSNYVEQDENPYGLGATDLNGELMTTKIFSENTTAYKSFSIVFGYEFSASISDAPAQTLLPLQAQAVSCINGNIQAATSNSPLNTGSTPYILGSTTKLFLSDIEDGYITSILYQTGKTQRASLAFLNGSDISSLARYMHVSYFNESTALNTGYFQNINTNGGAAPVAGLTDAQTLLYVGVGTYNLESQAINSLLKPSDGGNTGWTHYYIQWSSATTLSGFELSAAYKFERVTCGKYIADESAFSLHWWNSKGGIDNLPVLGKMSESQDMSKKDYRTSGGNSFNANGSSTPYVKHSWEGGKRSTDVLTTTTFRLSTLGGNPDRLTPLIRSLANSSRVYISGKNKYGLNSAKQANNLIQVYVKNTQVKYKSNINDRAATYELEVEVSRRRANP
tara:strand:+ start:2251 stop:3627 length:1377 start_codon:yes stop_codon:yes gene_type:complete